MATSAIIPVRFNPARLRTWIFRIPFCTRLLVLIIVSFWIAGVVLSWVPARGALIPAKVSIWSSKCLLIAPLHNLHRQFQN